MFYYHNMSLHGRIRIVRISKKRNYIVLDNRLPTDRQLPWAARGLLCYLLCKPDDWQVRLYDLVRRGPAGERKIRRILSELEHTAYLRRQRSRLPHGCFEWLTMVVECPSR